MIGLDTASGAIGTRAYSFFAHPLAGAALRFSEIVLADGCLPQSDQAGRRRNLFDPVLLEDCQLAPAASGSFRPSQNPTVFVRLYPPSERLAKLITKQWKAHAVVDGVSNASAISITYPDVRGPAASGKLLLSQMHLKPGPHKLTVIFEAPADGGKKHSIPLNTEFSIAP